jgi:hypothetical protein
MLSIAARRSRPMPSERRGTTNRLTACNGTGQRLHLLHLVSALPEQCLRPHPDHALVAARLRRAPAREPSNRDNARAAAGPADRQQRLAGGGLVDWAAGRLGGRLRHALPAPGGVTMRVSGYVPTSALGLEAHQPTSGRRSRPAWRRPARPPARQLPQHLAIHAGPGLPAALEIADPEQAACPSERKARRPIPL